MVTIILSSFIGSVLSRLIYLVNDLPPLTHSASLNKLNESFYWSTVTGRLGTDAKLVVSLIINSRLYSLISIPELAPI